MQLKFCWSEAGETPREYLLQHDQAIDGLPLYWENAPGVRPDFYIERVTPQPEKVEVAGNLIWREPGYVLDAKYYKPRANPKAPGEPVKRMLADLSLTGNYQGFVVCLSRPSGG